MDGRLLGSAPSGRMRAELLGDRAVAQGRRTDSVALAASYRNGPSGGVFHIAGVVSRDGERRR